MANAAEFLARWKARYIDAEGRILEELDTTLAECVEDANDALGLELNPRTQCVVLSPGPSIRKRRVGALGNAT
jgi:hypothetical protein